jgi:hypothetical protein
MKTKKHLIRFPGDVLLRKRQVCIILGLLLMTLLSDRQNLFAFSSKPLNGPQPNAPWVLDTTVANVDFFYMISECEGKKVVFLKFNNRNSNKVKVNWKEVFSTQFEKHREGFRGEKQLVLSQGETFQSDCSQINVKECMVLPSEVSPSYNADIVTFRFSKISVGNAF